MDELVRRTFEERETKLHRLAFQSLAPLIDTTQQGVDLAAEAFRISRHLAPQHGEVMVIAEEVTQSV